MQKEMIYNMMNGFCDSDAVAMPNNVEVTDEFTEGTECCKLAEKIYQAKMNLCDKLDDEKDEDLEIIINSMEEIMRILALKMYDYGKIGNGYISWARANYGSHTAMNATEFSDMMAERMGWDSYGDKQNVSHVSKK